MIPRTFLAVAIGLVVCSLAFCRYALIMTFTGLSMRSSSEVFLGEASSTLAVVWIAAAMVLGPFLLSRVARWLAGQHASFDRQTSQEVKPIWRMGLGLVRRFRF